MHITPKPAHLYLKNEFELAENISKTGINLDQSLKDIYEDMTNGYVNALAHARNSGFPFKIND